MFFRVGFCRSNCRSKVHSLLAYELISISLLTSTPRGTTVPFVAVNRGVLQKLTKWMGANKKKKKPYKMVGLSAPTSSLQHPHILLGGNYILPDVGCLPFSEYILCLHVWVLSPTKMHHFVGTWCCAICLRFFHSVLGSLGGTTHPCNDM